MVTAVAYKQYSNGIKRVLKCVQKNVCLFSEVQVWQLIQMVAQHPLLFPPWACKDTTENAQGSRNFIIKFIVFLT